MVDDPSARHPRRHVVELDPADLTRSPESQLVFAPKEYFDTLANKRKDHDELRCSKVAALRGQAVCPADCKSESVTNSTQDERQIQRLCIDAGFGARMRDLDSDRNPFFDDGHGGGEFVWTEEDARILQRAQAWWFGWHEADDACARRLGRPGE